MNKAEMISTSCSSEEKIDCKIRLWNQNLSKNVRANLEIVQVRTLLYPIVGSMYVHVRDGWTTSLVKSIIVFPLNCKITNNSASNIHLSFANHLPAYHLFHLVFVWLRQIARSPPCLAPTPDAQWFQMA